MLLALETSTPCGSVALLDGARVAGEDSIGSDRARHAAGLLDGIDRILAVSGSSLEQVDLIALSIGPGSFTGLRIGLATALGLCFGTERRLVPVSTLAALSTHAGPVGRIVPMLDARRGQVYGGIYTADGAALGPDRVGRPEDLLDRLRGQGPVHLLGSGARAHLALIERILGDDGIVLPPEQDVPRASSVGRLGALAAARGEARPPEQVELAYLRPSDAEEKRGAGHVEGKAID